MVNRVEGGAGKSGATSPRDWGGARGVFAGVLTSVASGMTGAFFLWALDGVTGMHRANPWLLGLLPVLGVAGAWMYRAWGGEAEIGRAHV